MFSSPAPGFSIARLAQSVERKALNLVVVGSSPTVGAFAVHAFYQFGGGGDEEEEETDIDDADDNDAADDEDDDADEDDDDADDGGGGKTVTAVGFEPTPLRTGA